KQASILFGARALLCLLFCFAASRPAWAADPATVTLAVGIDTMQQNLFDEHLARVLDTYLGDYTVDVATFATVPTDAGSAPLWLAQEAGPKKSDFWIWLVALE